jgi:hypothetical protein
VLHELGASVVTLKPVPAGDVKAAVAAIFGICGSIGDLVGAARAADEVEMLLAETRSP